MAKWRGERRSLSPSGFWSDQEWDTDLGRRSLRSLSPLALSGLDFWDSRSLFKTQKSPAWSCVGLSRSNPRSKISASTLGLQNHSGSLGITIWSSASRLAPEGSQHSHSSAEDFKLRSVLEESSRRRAELIQRLRETRSHLDAQTDFLKTKGAQLQQSKSLLEIKQKLSEAVNALEKDKEVMELSRIEESRRRGELQDKVLELELDIMKMRSNLDRRASLTSNQLNGTLTATKDQRLREGQRQVEKEMKKLKEALRTAEEKIDDLEYEKDGALRQLYSSEEHKQEAINQAEDLEQKLSSSIKTQADLEEQLNESRRRLGQMELEKDLISGKIQRLEDSLNDLKVKLSGALMDKDHLFQEKAELLQRNQTLDLQVQKEQRSKQGLNEQMSELHSELSQAKSQANKHKMDAILMKEEMVSVKELNKKLSCDLTKAAERLQMTLNQLHELEAEKLIRTNQIAALETERLQLIGAKEEMKKTFDDGLHEKIRELGERSCQHMEQQDYLEQENQTLQLKCCNLEHKVQTLEAEFKCKEEEHHHMRAGFEREKEELRKVAAHWNERWLDVAMTLSSTQKELDELKRQEQDKGKLETNFSDIPLDDRQELVLESQMQKSLMVALPSLCTYDGELFNLDFTVHVLRVSSEDVDEELMKVKSELLKVRDVLKIRDAELEERLLELQSARDQEAQQCGEVQRLEQLLEEREQEIKVKDEDLKNLEIQRITEKAAAQIKISALEQEISGHKGLQSTEEVVSEWSSEDLESPKALLEESRRRAERLELERDQALQKLCDLESPQQAKAEEKCLPKKQKPAGSDLLDPNRQRQLVTEQLKTLFRERERRGESSPVLPRKPGLVQNATNSKNWNAVDTTHQGGETQKPDLQQEAAKGSSSQISVSQGGSKKRSEGGEEQKQPITLKHNRKITQPK